MLDIAAGDLGASQVRSCVLRPPLVVLDLRREEVRASDLERVVGDLGERPGVTNGRQRRIAVALHPQEPRPLPVQGHALAKATELVGAVGRLVEDLARAVERAHRRESRREEAAVADLCRHAPLVEVDLGDAPLEELNPHHGSMRGQVRAREGLVDVGPGLGTHRARRDDGLELPNRTDVVSLSRQDDPERRPNPGGEPVGDILVEQFAQHLLGAVDVVPEPQLELGVGKA